jgi:hypothetical protein
MQLDGTAICLASSGLPTIRPDLAWNARSRSKSELPCYYELKFETNVERCAHRAESCSPEKVNNWEVLCEVGGRPGCDGFFSQGYRGDLSRWRGESSKKGVVQGESRRFIGGDFVVNQYRVAFA